jgi:hypothetical protein
MMQGKEFDIIKWFGRAGWFIEINKTGFLLKG